MNFLISSVQSPAASKFALIEYTITMTRLSRFGEVLRGSDLREIKSCFRMVLLITAGAT